MISDEEYQERIQDLVDRKFKKLYFIHIPKAAGSYVRKFPIEASVHGNHEQFHNHAAYEGERVVDGETGSTNRLLEIGKIVSGYSMITKVKNSNISQDSLKFATVRNPFDYLMSCYFSGMVGAEQNLLRCNIDHKDVRIACNKCNGIGYEKFLILFSKSKMLYLPCRKNLFHQIFDDQGVCNVDLIIRAEYLTEGLDQLNSVILGRDRIKNIPNERVNQSKKRKKRDYREFYTSDVREMVEKKVRKELDMFGYTFDGPVDKRPFVFLDKNKRYDIF
jgi:hypothetical protein